MSLPTVAAGDAQFQPLAVKFGRSFARAYLEVHHDFAWFVAIDRGNFQLSPHWRVKRAIKAEMPDLTCAKPGQLAIAEAEGSHQKDKPRARPGPVRSGPLRDKFAASGFKSGRAPSGRSGGTTAR